MAFGELRNGVKRTAAQLASLTWKSGGTNGA